MTDLTPEQIGSASSQAEDIQKIRENQKRSDYIMIGIIVVLFIGFLALAVALGAMIVDAYRSRESSYQSLGDKVEALKNEVHQQKGFRQY